MVSPYRYDWTNVSSGDYNLTARAFDDKGAITTSAAVRIVVKESDNIPTIVITAPDDEATFVGGEPITIFADTKDSNGVVDKVEFFNGDTKIGESLTAPYTFVWSDPTIGNHSIIAKASNNNQSIISVSPPISISVIEPVIVVTIEITAPVDNTIVASGTSVEITAHTEINKGTINKVEFFDGDQKLSEDLTIPFSYIWSNIPSGNHELIAKATTDQNTVVKSKVITIVVTEPTEETPSITENIIPRYFTPNDDGLNDVWEFAEHELLENAHVMVFNRSGQKVYEGYTYQDAWDGKLEGKPLQEDAYYYVIRLSDSNDIKGAVRIIR
jgi:gliding motility-associated-like protein